MLRLTTSIVIAIFIGICLHPSFYLFFQNSMISWLSHFSPLGSEDHQSIQVSHWKCDGSTSLTRHCYGENICIHQTDAGYKLTAAPNHGFDRYSSSHLPESFLCPVGVFPQYSTSLSHQTIGSDNVTWITDTAYIIHRFKPDNIMHVIHDDILPSIRSMHKNAQINCSKLIAIDGYDIFQYHSLYATVGDIIYINESQRPVCFHQAMFGSDRQTLWYQYGFENPQGPLLYDAAMVLDSITTFSSLFLKSHLADMATVSPDPDYIIILSRKSNRLILNENTLLLAIAKRFRCSVRMLSEESHSLFELISTIRTSKAVIGMHGALLSLIIFARPETLLVELFPYAVPPENYTPYRHLAGITKINYVAWQNRDISKTVGHPDYPPHYGGVLHLAEDTQEKILEQTKIPPHLCCSDPSWLYHIYQDTEVDVDHIVRILDDNLA